MTKDEFVDLHGEEAWKQIVEPIQIGLNDYAKSCDRCYAERCNANILWHSTITTILGLLNLPTNSLINAKKIINREKD